MQQGRFRREDMIHHPGAQPHGYVSILIPRGVDWFCLAGMGRFWKAPKALQSVVRGYFAYHAVPGNWKALGTFRTQCARIWYRALRRRSQKSRLTWDRMTQIADAWLPPARILHPWPEQRLAALIQGKSRMQ
jgi:hypothetical protein